MINFSKSEILGISTNSEMYIEVKKMVVYKIDGIELYEEPISVRSQKFLDEIHTFAHSNSIAKAKKLQKQIAEKFGLRSVYEVRKNGVVQLHDGRLFVRIQVVGY